MLPEWEIFFKAYGIQPIKLNRNNLKEAFISEQLNQSGPEVFLIEADPEQTYLPKIMSKINKDGTMVSNPIHLMSPELEPKLQAFLTPFLQ